MSILQESSFETFTCQSPAKGTVIIQILKELTQSNMLFNNIPAQFCSILARKFLVIEWDCLYVNCTTIYLSLKEKNLNLNDNLAFHDKITFSRIIKNFYKKTIKSVLAFFNNTILALVCESDVVRMKN